MALMMFERGAPRDPLEAALFGDFFGDGPGAFGLLPFAGRRAGPPGRKRGPCGPAARRRLALDVAEHEGSYEISADLPGVKRENVQLEVGHDGVLKLSVGQAAEKKVRFEGEEKNPPPSDEGRAGEVQEGEAAPEKQQPPAIKWRRVERSRRFESRAVQLPPDADAAAVSAALADGVLHLSVPKKAEPASRRVEIQ